MNDAWRSIAGRRNKRSRSRRPVEGDDLKAGADYPSGGLHVLGAAAIAVALAGIVILVIVIIR